MIAFSTFFAVHSQNEMEFIPSDDLVKSLKKEGKKSAYYEKPYLSILLYLDESIFSLIDSIKPEMTFMNQYKLNVADHDFKIVDTEATDIREVFKSLKQFNYIKKVIFNGNKACFYRENYGKNGFSSSLECYQLERKMLLMRISMMSIE